MVAPNDVFQKPKKTLLRYQKSMKNYKKHININKNIKAYKYKNYKRHSPRDYLPQER